MPNVVRAVQQQLAKGAGLTINQYGSTTLNGRNRPKANTARLFRFTSTLDGTLQLSRKGSPRRASPGGLASSEGISRS